MLLTSRSLEILKKIMDLEHPLRVKELASEFQVSERTIKYDLDSIRLWLKEHDAHLSSQPNKGIWFDGDVLLRHKLQGMLVENDKHHVFLNQLDRVENIVLDLLLADQYLILQELAEKVGVSRNTILADMQKVEDFLRGWNLHLERKSATGIRLVGSEFHRRLACEYLLQARLSSKEMFQIVQAVMEGRFQIHDEQLSEKLLLPLQEMDLVLHAVKDLAIRIKEESGVFFTDRVIIGALIRLSLVISRMHQQHELNLEIDFQPLEGSQQSKVYGICQEVLNGLANQLGMKFPATEVFYISLQVISGSLPLMEKELNEHFEILDPVIIAQAIIARASELLEVPFAEDAELMDNLLAHLSEKLAKFRYGVIEPNPLVTQIKRSYQQMFEQIKHVCADVLSEVAIYFTDPDIAYIVLHFQAAYERKQATVKLKTFVVCGTGRGTARLVRTLIENELTNIQVVGIYSIMEVEKALKTHIVDFVVSVLPISLPIPVVVVNPIPTKSDFAAIFEVTKQLGRQRSEAICEPDFPKSPMHKLSALSSELSSEQLPLMERISRDIIIRGFELSQVIISTFKTHLTEQATAGLMLHISLMVHRLVFATPYEDHTKYEPMEPDYVTKLRSKLVQILQEHDLTVPQGEMEAILRYFHAPKIGGEKIDR